MVDGVEKENVGTRETAEAVALCCAHDMAQEGVTAMIADYSCWDNDTGYNSVADFFMNAGIDMIKCVKHTNNGRRSWNLVHELLTERDEDGSPYLRIFSSCKYLIREMSNIQCDKNNPEECDTRQADHALDALRYALYSDLYERASKEVEPIYSDAQKRAFVYNPVDKGYWQKRREVYH